MLYRNQNDETLVMLTLAGEQSAYEALVLRHQKAVIAAADSVIHSRFMAEDAAQDAFVTAWMKLNTLQDAAKFGAWVCRIAKNCALNMARRFHNYMPLEAVENIDIHGDRNQNPAELYALSEEKEELHKTVSRLPEKVRKIIQLHYFEGLSVLEIAERMGITEGTVKSQLHDGRKRIRKELCAMNEQWNDTLVQRVMKKVEELKLWQYKNSKNGFEKVYKDVLREVEELPECSDKYHALADVLMRGWWWIPGKKNDALFERIKESASLGKNDDVMIFIFEREVHNLYGEAKKAFIRDVKIPELEKAGFKQALGYAWYRLALDYLDEPKDNDFADGIAAAETAMKLLPENELYHHMASQLISLEKNSDKYKDKNARTYRNFACAEEYRFIDGTVLRYKDKQTGDGKLYSYDSKINGIFINASYCDRRFTVENLAVGGTHIGTDGTKLTFESDSETVETSCGIFENCQLWVSRKKSVKCSTWYKEGIGIVKQTRTNCGIGETRTLKSYEIKGGKGILPFCVGNRWEYEAGFDPNVIDHDSVITVSYLDSEKVILTHNWHIERLKYDDNSWLDMIRRVRGEYWGYANGRDGKQVIQDVSYPINRSLALAKTDMEKAHAKASASVARRIMETDPIFNPDYKATGHWNFFSKSFVSNTDGVITVDDEFQWDFEWKHTGGLGTAGWPILFNHIYDILQDTAQCIWSDNWKDGFSDTLEFFLWDSYPIETTIECSNAGEITTAAGKFQNCLKVAINATGFEAGIEYRGGKKVYYYAPKVGMVRIENEFCDGAKTAIYELAYYEGEGEGYMPIEGGLVRRYEALNLTDGYRAAAEYTYAADEEGNVCIFSDRTGVRDVCPNITQYSAIYDETREEPLWHKGDHTECRLLHDINNYKLMIHFLYRDSWNLCAPQRNAVWQKYKCTLMETFRDEKGEIPRGWWGFYADAHFASACTLFGCDTPKEKEEGYEYLEKAFRLYEKWLAIPDGELLEVGNAHLFGGIKLKKGTGIVVLPDGRMEYITDKWIFTYIKPERMYNGMTAKQGWEWFDPVRNEDRFKDYIKRAEELMKKYK